MELPVAENTGSSIRLPEPTSGQAEHLTDEDAVRVGDSSRVDLVQPVPGDTVGPSDLRQRVAGPDPVGPSRGSRAGVRRSGVTGVVAVVLSSVAGVTDRHPCRTGRVRGGQPEL